MLAPLFDRSHGAQRLFGGGDDLECARARHELQDHAAVVGAADGVNDVVDDDAPQQQRDADSADAAALFGRQLDHFGAAIGSRQRHKFVLAHCQQGGDQGLVGDEDVFCCGSVDLQHASRSSGGDVQLPIPGAYQGEHRTRDAFDHNFLIGTRFHNAVTADRGSLEVTFEQSAGPLDVVHLGLARLGADREPQQ